MMKQIINAKDISVEFPIYNFYERNFKKLLIHKIIGGNLLQCNQTIVIKALNCISFKIYQGNRVALLGNNGSGKTTLLQVLAGIYKPTSGFLSIYSKNVVSLIDVTMGMESEATGYQNIFIRGLLLGLTIKQITKYISFIIDFSELGDYILLPVRTYSSGMLFRLAFSIISVLKPDILLIDEWLTVSDNDFKDKINKKLQQMIDQSSVMILASHSNKIIKTFCNIFFLMRNGSLQQISREKVDCYLE